LENLEEDGEQNKQQAPKVNEKSSLKKNMNVSQM